MFSLFLIGSLASSTWIPEYDRYKLFELVLCADVVVAGKIEEVGSTTFQLRVTRVIVGDHLTETLCVDRF